jgi:hypothetical protein
VVLQHLVLGRRYRNLKVQRLQCGEADGTEELPKRTVVRAWLRLSLSMSTTALFCRWCALTYG